MPSVDMENIFYPFLICYRLFNYLTLRNLVSRSGLEGGDPFAFLHFCLLFNLRRRLPDQKPNNMTIPKAIIKVK